MKKIIFTLLVSLTFTVANAQFYNGLQMTFGKNRIQYKPFNWNYYRNVKYDVYSYDRGTNLGKYVDDNVEQIMDEMSSYFGISLNERAIFIVYNKLSDFRQSNIGLETGNVDFNIGGQIQLQDNKVFLYYEGDHQKFLNQLRMVIASLYVNQVLYGTAFTDKITSSTLLNVPEWFEKGLVSYIANPYDIESINYVKDFLINRKRISFNHLTDKDAVYVGHTFWYYISDVYGEDVISNILYFSKISKSIKNAIYFVLGNSLKSLAKDWRAYYEENLNIENVTLPDPDDEIKITKKNRIYQQFKVSPDGDNIAFVENYEGKYKVFLYNTETKKVKKLYKEGQRLEQIVDYTYPVLTWNPNGKTLAFITEKESIAYLWLYNIETEELKSMVVPYVSKVLDFSFAPRGGYMVFSATANGFTDLFVFNLLTSKMDRITYDLADDLNPQFDSDAKKIIFSSNRSVDSIQKDFLYERNYPLSDNFDLFVYDFENKSPALTRLTKTPFSNEKNPVRVGQDKYIYLSDSTGVVNRFVLNYDSTIAFVDTTVHYRFFSSSNQVTDYTQDINSQDLKGNVLGQIMFSNKKDRLYSSRFTPNNLQPVNKNGDLYFFTQKNIDRRKRIIDKYNLEIKQKIYTQNALNSLKPLFDDKLNKPDSSIVDINNYVFEIEQDTLFGEYYSTKNKTDDKNSKDTVKVKQLLAYKPTFYLNDLTSQIDFSMINQSYQAYSGGPFYFNPGTSIYTTVSVDELFNNYKLTAGFRWAFNGAKEYLFSVENLEKRLDKQIVFHRQILRYNSSDYYTSYAYKTIANEMMFITRYPFTQVASVRTSLIGKYDRSIYLSTDYSTLEYPDTFNVYSAAKLEFIFDNTRELSTNLEEGIKLKLFGEFYQQVHGNYLYTGVLGGDVRFYKNIFRNMIFATRLAGSTSLGTGKVIFYLGGVDSWVDLSFDGSGTSYFDQSVNINTDETYLFQAVATNMRGFPQNIRNGNSFLVSNTELRAPVVQMLYPYPVNSDFWYNLQLIGFFDIGSAWSGLTPYSDKNYYNEITTTTNTFTVIVDVDRPPFVYGYGFGIRSKVLGYFFRFDWAWGVEANYHYDRKFYFSLSKDF